MFGAIECFYVELLYLGNCNRHYIQLLYLNYNLFVLVFSVNQHYWKV